MSQSMQGQRILAVIANYGTKNDVYLNQVLAAYRAMPHDVDVMVLTSAPKHLGTDIDVVIHEVRGNPWSFPFAHKSILAELVNDYDLFVYSEDDILIKEHNVDAFVFQTKLLREDEIPGFLRIEVDNTGERFFPDVHKRYHWDPSSVVARGGELFARFTNEHSGCYILTQEQLQRAMSTGGFLGGPQRRAGYGLPETAATDPYTQCGFKKLICISRFEEMLVPHLPNKYIGKMGICENDLNRQIAALKEIQMGKRNAIAVLNGRAEMGNALWHKTYHEQEQPEVLAQVPPDARTVLSYGCGYGVAESKLAEKGVAVTAIPLDSVIGASVEARGLEVIYGEGATALSLVGGRQFDCIVLSDLLPLIDRPEGLLLTLSKHLSPGGVIVMTVPNMSYLRILRRRIAEEGLHRAFTRFDTGGVHRTTIGRVKNWLSRSGLRARRIVPAFHEGAGRANRISIGMLDDSLASQFVVVAGQIRP